MEIGIMQGRLVPPSSGHPIQSFPRDDWEREFSCAASAGLDFIEWIYDSHGEDVNPIASDVGVARMRGLAAEHGVAVRSICADWFMEHPLVRVPHQELRARCERLRWLIDRAGALGAGHIVLPFVDASRIESATDAERVLGILDDVLRASEAAGIELHLETSLSPASFAQLLSQVDHPLVRVNYDSGNSASLGYDVREEFASYGTRVGSVHVKDRVRHGGTVPLGAGDADLPALVSCLLEYDYRGNVVLQVARERAGEEVELARRNVQYVRTLLAHGGQA
jgi:L-ribulose-5-phosphate 3-epimerase